MDQNVEFYDSNVQEYFQEWKDNALLLPWLRDLVGKTSAAKHVLDLGCGPGCESRRLVDIGAKVTGIDLSEAALSIARVHVPEAEFIRMDVRNLNLKGMSFDAVLEASLLFHFNDLEQQRILMAIHKALCPAGRFLSVYRTGSFCGIQKQVIEGKELQRTVNLKSMEAWSEQVCSVGFDVVTPAQTVLGPFVSFMFEKR
jgi:2-polyprenyl-3-methyl-5-hydroxy-6-metoxy-1,4-benzoquinol methylase